MKVSSSKRQNMWVAPQRDWTPFDLPYLIGWNTNRHLQGFSVGDNRVSNWADSSQNGNALTSPSDTPSPGAVTERPNIATSSNFGGKQVAVFDASDDKSMILNPPPNALDFGLGDFFFASAFRFTGTAESVLCSAQKQSNSNEIRISLQSSNGVPKFRLGNGGTITGSDNLFDSTTLLVATRVAGTISLFINGASVGSLGGTVMVIGGDEPLRLGAVDLGGGKGVTGQPTGEIAEFIYGGSSSTGVITDFDRQRLEGYLAHEVGISSVLPTTHPYKYGPPKRAT